MRTAFQFSDYERMSDGVVSDFMSKSASLNDGILKLAQDLDLNPEQVKRLVEMSNTKAFLKIFNKKNEGTRDVDFDVADAKKILKDFFSADGPKSMKITKVTISKMPTDTMCPSLESDFPDMMEGTRRGKPALVVVKSASEQLEEKVAEADDTFNTKTKYKEILKLRKVAEELMNRVYESEHDYNERLDKLASDFCKLYGPDYGAFEEDVIVRYGTDNAYVKYALDDIRKYVRWKKPMYMPSSKTLMNKVANLTTPEVKLLDEMYKLKEIQVKYAEGIKVTNRKLEELCS